MHKIISHLIKESRPNLLSNIFRPTSNPSRGVKTTSCVSICTHHRLDPINGLRNRYLPQNRPQDDSPPRRDSALPLLSVTTYTVGVPQPFKTVRLCLSSYSVNAWGGKRWCGDWQCCGRLWRIGFMFKLSCVSCLAETDFGGGYYREVRNACHLQ